MTREELLQRAVNAGVDINNETAMHKFEQHMRNADPNSHMRPGGLFDPERGKRPVMLAGVDEDDANEAAVRQNIRRTAVIAKTVQDALVNRVQEPTGVNIMKVTHEEYMTIFKEFVLADREGCSTGFTPFSKYGSNLLYYADGKPRPFPVRPLMKNEVGMYGERIVCIKDNNPGDIGEGKYFVVPANAPVGEPVAEEIPVEIVVEETVGVEDLHDDYDGGTR